MIDIEQHENNLEEYLQSIKEDVNSFTAKIVSKYSIYTRELPKEQ